MIKGVEKSAPIFKGGDSMYFTINGIEWNVVFVHPMSKELLRSDKSRTVGVTDWGKRTVFLSDMLYGAFLRKVIAHELVHCFMMSYSIHIPIEEEEFIADWVATYGTDLIYLLDDLMQTLKKAYIA